MAANVAVHEGVMNGAYPPSPGVGLGIGIAGGQNPAALVVGDAPPPIHLRATQAVGVLPDHLLHLASGQNPATLATVLAVGDARHPIPLVGAPGIVPRATPLDLVEGKQARNQHKCGVLQPSV